MKGAKANAGKRAQYAARKRMLKGMPAAFGARRKRRR